LWKEDYYQSLEFTNKLAR